MLINKDFIFKTSLRCKIAEIEFVNFTEFLKMLTEFYFEIQYVNFD